MTTSRWSDDPCVPRGDAYDARFRELEASGADVHGEADLVASFEPASVLDAGCGTGRVAIELARRGVDVVGVDLDDGMLDTARANAPDLTWVTADLATLDLGATFDAVVAAGNVMIFLQPGTEATVVERLAAHLAPGGVLIAGFQLHPGGYDLGSYDAHCAAAGLSLAHRWSTWNRDEFPPNGADYAVSLHRNP